MSNIGLKEAYCQECGVVYTCESHLRLKEEARIHEECTGHKVEIRTKFML